MTYKGTNKIAIVPKVDFFKVELLMRSATSLNPFFALLYFPRSCRWCFDFDERDEFDIGIIEEMWVTGVRMACAPTAPRLRHISKTNFKVKVVKASHK